MSFTPEQIAFLEANRDSVEARRIFRIDFASGTVRLPATVNDTKRWRDQWTN